jgi:hypothetical protein
MRRSTIAASTLLVIGLASAVAFSESREKKPRATVQVFDVSLVEGTADQKAAAPVSLTASDGTGLRLTSMSIRAAIEDPMALTELKLTFENPESRVLEGNFKVTLPPGASLSRFAMKTDAGWQEGEVVEKQAARRAYEDFLHRRQDPALLEQAPGNEFAARVFPIPANGKKEIILAYSQAIPKDASYTFPLKGLGKLDDLSVEVFAAGARDPVVNVQRSAFLPGNDLTVRSPSFARRGGVRSGDLMMARVVPIPRGEAPPAPLGATVFLVDTSASRALGLKEELQLLRELLAQMAPGTRISVLAFDQTTEVMFDGAREAFGDAEVLRIVSRNAMGASNLEQALVAAGEHAKARRDAPSRLVILGDGVVTAGETDEKKLQGKVEGLRASPLQRIDAVVLGGIRDESRLRSLVRGQLAQDGVMLHAKEGSAEIVRRLSLGTRSKIEVKVEGATFTYPDRIDGVQAGDEVLVFAQVPDGKSPRITLGDAAPFTPELRTVERPLLERAWASAKIESLRKSPPNGDAEAAKKEIVRVSTRYRVTSDFTAMLVLETDADYKRFDIDRKAKLDILTVDDGRIKVAQASRTGPEDEADDGKDKKDSPARRDMGGSGARAKGEEGSMGRPTSTGSRFGVQGPSGGDGDPHIQRQAALRDAAEFGMIGVIDAEEAPPPPPPGAANGSPITIPPAEARPAPRRIPDVGDPRAAATATAEREEEAPGHRGLVTGAGRAGASRLSVQLDALQVTGGLTQDAVRRMIEANMGRVRACSDAQAATGTVGLRLAIDATGHVSEATLDGSSLPSSSGRACVSRVVSHLTFPTTGAAGTARVDIGFSSASTQSAPVSSNAAYTGRFATVMSSLKAGKKDDAVREAESWYAAAPADVMALVALGEAKEATGDKVAAARAYGSVLELFSFRADSRRFAGERLERLGTPFGFALAADAFRGAAEQRPDHPASHRLLAFSLLRDGKYKEAFEAMETGAKHTYPEGRFRGVDRILREDLALVGAAWIKADPGVRADVEKRIAAAGATPENEPSLRFVLVWETDANDVDFHIRDRNGGHAYYGAKDLPSGGNLYADVTTGYGPECFTIRNPVGARAYPYQLSAHYYSRGPMGYGMGKLQILEHDGKGGLKFEERPFVIMTDHSFVDLGTITGPLK